MRKFLLLGVFLSGCYSEFSAQDAGDCLLICTTINGHKKCAEVCPVDSTDSIGIDTSDTSTIFGDTDTVNDSESHDNTDTDTEIPNDGGLDTETEEVHRGYYIDPINGSDENPGTVSAPWRTTYHINTGINPPDIELQAGDTVYLREGLHASMFQGTDNMYVSAWLNLHNISGTPENPITIRNYPGEHPVINPGGQGMGVFLLNSSFIDLYGLDIQDAYYRGISVDLYSTGIRVWRCSISNTDGWVGDNVSGIEFRLADNFELRKSILFDNYDHKAANAGQQTENSCNVFIHRGTNISEITDNVIYYTQAPGSEWTGCGIKYKHSSVDHNSELRIRRNYIENVRYTSIGLSSHDVIVQDNLINGVTNPDDWGPGHAIDLRDWGGLTHLMNIDISHNTIVASRPLFYYPTDINTDGENGPWNDLTGINISDNIFEMHDAPGNDPHIEIYTAIDDRLYELALEGTTFNRNCYHTYSAPTQFGFAEDTYYGELGGRYIGLLAWQAAYPQWDQDSYETDPQYDDRCDGKGARHEVSTSKEFIPPETWETLL